MKDLHQIIEDALEIFDQSPSNTWAIRPNPTKWSRIEILGHLVDSARINLQRFNEIQYFDSPYTVRPYPQDQLVIINSYQKHSYQVVVTIWKSLNYHISYLIENYSDTNYSKPVILTDGTETDFRWLVEDYIAHLEHHLAQIHNHPSCSI